MNLKLFTIFLLVICSDEYKVYAGLSKITEISKSVVDVATGVAKKIPESIPSPEAIFSTSKNLIAGYPIEVALSAVNLFCSAAVSSKNVKPRETPNVEQMNFILLTESSNFSIALQKPDQLWKHPSFNRTMKTVILVTGWTSNVNETNTAIDLIAASYACRGDVNFIAVDTAQFVDTLYSWSAFNTEEIGRIIGTGLNDLCNDAYPVENIHLIGHSLGAHIVGAAGRTFNELSSGQLIPRITGLDPARPCFNAGETLTGLSRGDAEFVDIIHSNPGALGKRDPLGDADFYPNGLDPLPPGCFTITCAHARAYEFYAESVYPGNEDSFLCVKCGSLTALNTGYCKGKKIAMGYAVPTSTKGNFFLNTDGRSPFGRDSKGPTGTHCKVP